MEDVLDLYAEPPDPKRPVVCFDESPTQLIGEARQPIPAAPGQLERYDYEYRRNGTVNLFVFLDAHRPWRKVKVTDQRTARDFAQCMRELVDIHYPQAEQIRVVLDNLSTHSAGALYETFPAPEARPHDAPAGVPLHAQTRQLAQHGRDRDRRAARPVPRPAHRRPSSGSCPKSPPGSDQRNAAGARVKWMFTTERARAKMAPRLSQTNRHSQAARQKIIITVLRN